MQASRSVGVLVALSAGVAFAACGDDDSDDSVVESTVATSVAAEEPADTDGPPADDAAPAWSYSGDAGPESWGELEGYETCGAGTEQSPIDLVAASEADLVNPEFSYAASSFTLENNGHTVQTLFDGDNSMTVDGTSYGLLQLHYHTPSEHEIDGASSPAEFHLVHEADDGRLAVVGVMIAEGEENPLLTASLADYPSEKGAAVGSTELDPTGLLPAEHTTYRYAGSLTTPPCSEGIAWFVMTEPVTASAEQISSLEALFGANNRPLQALNDRVIERDTSN